MLRSLKFFTLFFLFLFYFLEDCFCFCWVSDNHVSSTSGHVAGLMRVWPTGSYHQAPPPSWNTFSPCLLLAKQGCCFIKTWNPWRMVKSSRKIMRLHHDQNTRGPFLVNRDFNRTQEICWYIPVSKGNTTDGHNSLLLPVVSQGHGARVLALKGHTLKMFINKLLWAVSVLIGKKMTKEGENYVYRGFKICKRSLCSL